LTDEEQPRYSSFCASQKDRNDARIGPTGGSETRTNLWQPSLAVRV
jgi:hypothetical protein